MSSYSVVPPTDDVEDDIPLKDHQASSPLKQSFEIDCAVGTTSFIHHEDDEEEHSARNSRESVGFETGEPRKQPSFLRREITISVSLLLLIGIFSLLLLIPIVELFVQRQVIDGKNPSNSTGMNPNYTVTTVTVVAPAPPPPTPLSDPQQNQATGPELEDIDGDLDPRALQELCARTVWQDGLVITMAQNAAGGLSNVRNVFQNSLRFAIEAGASAYVIPRMVPRNPCALGDWLTNDLRDFSHLFDRSKFKANMAIVCPQMKIYDDINDLEGQDWALTSTELSPKSLDSEVHHDYTTAHASLWRSLFDNFLISSNVVFSPAQPALLEIHDAFLEWPIQADTPAIVATFGRMYQAPSPIRQIAVKVLTQLKTQHSLNISLSRGAIFSDSSVSYFACHLRTEGDAMGNFGSYDLQAGTYLQIASTRGYKIMYVTSGDIGEVERIRAQALTDHGITVVTKYDLLKGEDREALRQLSWDQQAMIDLEVLLRAGYFAGVAASSFSYNAAVKRHTIFMSKDPNVSWTDGDIVQPWWSTTNVAPGPEDELSMLLANGNGELFQEGLWP